MDLKTIKELTDQEEDLQRRIREWYITNVHPEVVKCRSREELDIIWSQVSQACAGNDGTVRDLPGPLHVERVFSYDAVAWRPK